MRAFMRRGILMAALAPVLLLLSCSEPEPPKTPVPITKESAKQSLYERGIHYSTTTFFQTVRNNDVEAVNLFLLAGMDVDQRGEYANTALIRVLLNSDPAVAHLLIAKGADVNATTEYGNTPLLNATEQGNAEIVEALLKGGADVDVADSEGRTALKHAAGRGDVAIVQMLLAHGARVDFSPRGWDALRIATNNNHQEVVDLLTAAVAERSPQATDPSPIQASPVARAKPAPPPEPPIQPPEEPPARDNVFTVVVYGIPDDLPYDTRLFERMVPAMTKTFPVAQYPGIRDVQAAFKILLADPSASNGEKLEELFGAFAEQFDEVESEKFQEMYFDIVSREMTAMQVKIARETLDALLAVFPVASHPLLGDVVSAMQDFERTPDDEGSSKVEEAMAAFAAALKDRDRAKVEAIQESTEERLMAGDPKEMERQLIRGWVDDLERNRDWINGEVGAVVSPEAFDKLAENMSYTEVESIVGREGKQSSSLTYNINGKQTTSLQYEWSWPKDSRITASLSVWFLNGQLRVKSYKEL